ncbi:MAG TPA: Tim44-like domain-containing protein [Noviherbaspirillum sp.]
MKKFLISLMVALSALAIVVGDAQAKRMGGGSSVGRQSHNVSRQSAAPANNPGAQNFNKQAAPAAAPQSVPPKPASPWKSMLGGALLGLGLGALFSHLGLGGALGGMLGSLLTIALLVMAAMFLYRLFRRNSGNDGGGMRPAYAGAGGYGSASSARVEPEYQQPAQLRADSVSPGGESAPWGIPAGFDTSGFLRQAKSHFIRMQAVWDRADVNDLREFTTPELFAELRLQLQERGPSPNHTDVVSLDATMLGLETVNGEYFASVKFSGMIREAENAPAEAFTEVWNLTKPVSGQSGWVLAGIQQD